MKGFLIHLGIILFEMFSHFTTITEKASCVRDLKKGQCPPAFSKNYPKEVGILLRTRTYELKAEVVMWLMAKDPNNRPSVEELLASPLCDFPPEVPSVKELQQKLEEKEQVIQLQEARIKELEKMLNHSQP